MGRLTRDYTQRIVSPGMTGKDLRKHRKQLDLTQAGLAERLGVTANTVARWERDEITIREPMARLITLLKNNDRPTRRGR